MLNKVQTILGECQDALTQLRDNTATQAALVAASDMMVECLKGGNRIFSAGNGGSMCDAMHFAEELTGRFRQDRQPFAAMAISDSSHLSCVANDYGYDQVFARFLEAHARPGDVFLAISTSGKSENIVKAAEWAREAGVYVISLVGRKDSLLAKLSDIEILTPTASHYADRIQELHIKCIHIMIELIELNFQA